MASPSSIVCAAVRGISFATCAHSCEVVTSSSLCRNLKVRLCKGLHKTCQHTKEAEHICVFRLGSG